MHDKVRAFPAFPQRFWPMLGAAAVLFSCGGSGGGTDEGTDQMEVRYVLQWAEDGVVWDPGGGGFTVTNDQGYEVHISGGHLSSLTANLIPCPVPTGLLNNLQSFVLPTAHAAHPGQGDPSEYTTPVEQRLEDGALTFGTVEFPPVDYCETHYQIGRVLDSGGEVLASTLRLEGTSTSSSGSVSSFSLESNLVTGKTFTLPEQVRPSRRLEVTYVRDLAAWFSGLDFEVMNPVEVEFAVMLNLTDSTEISVRAY